MASGLFYGHLGRESGLQVDRLQLDRSCLWIRGQLVG